MATLGLKNNPPTPPPGDYVRPIWGVMGDGTFKIKASQQSVSRISSGEPRRKSWASARVEAPRSHSIARAAIAHGL